MQSIIAAAGLPAVARPRGSRRFPRATLRRAVTLAVLASALTLATAALAAPPAPRLSADTVPQSVDDLKQMEARQRELVQQARAATVGIQMGSTQGSGVIVSPDGYVLTAHHVAGEAGRDAWITTSRGQRVRGRTLGSNRSLDAALIKIDDRASTDGAEPPAHRTRWPYAPMGTVSALRPGTWCLALGHPGGYQPDRLAVARFGRVLTISDEALETDCILVGGDSGGPLFDLAGQVIGIHSRIGEQLTKNMHVPIGAYRAGWERMARGESWGRLSQLLGQPQAAERPAIGVLGDRTTQMPQIAEVIPGSPAEAAGLRSGDVMLRWDGKAVATFDALKAAVSRCQPGDEVPIIVLRRDEELTLTLVVGRLEGAAPIVSPGDAEALPRSGSDETAGPPGARGEPRNAPAVLQAFRSVVGQSAQSTVRVICQNQQVALGTIFDGDGLIATKASELRGPAVCELADGRRYTAELLGVDRASDLAVLRVPVGDLPAIEWRQDDPPAVGSWVVTPGPCDVPHSVGIVSVAPHPVRGGILGVQLAEDRPGPRITYVVPGSAADVAELQTGDLVTHINNVPIQTADALVTATSTLLPGDHIHVTIIRHNQPQQVPAVLGSVEETLSTQRARFQDRLGGALSARRVLFPLALEHDTVLQPQDCGGPLLDLDGQAVGINIARASRIASYAIPARVARSVLETLKAQAQHSLAHQTAAR